MARPCKYGCGMMLGDFDEAAHKYKEATTGGIHTKERCQEAKAKLDQKNDHGNELFVPKEHTQSGQQKTIGLGGNSVKEFVDHTAKGQSKVKIFTAAVDQEEELEEQYNDFLYVTKDKIKTQGAQYQLTQTRQSIALYYEEVK